MKKIFTNISILVLAALSITSCRKETEWNLNPAPSIELLSTTVISGTDTILISGGDIVTPFDGSRVELKLKLTGGNPLSQLTFHDGTWDDKNMTLITSSKQTLVTTPPASRYIMNGQKEEIVTIVLASVKSDIVLSMILNDDHGMSNSYSNKIKVKNIQVVKANVSNVTASFSKINKASDTLKFVGKDFVSFLNDSLTFSSVVKAQFNNDKIKGDSLDKLFPTQFALIDSAGTIYATSTDKVNKFGANLLNKRTNLSFSIGEVSSTIINNDVKFFYQTYYKTPSSTSAKLEVGKSYVINSSNGRGILTVTSITTNGSNEKEVKYTFQSYSIKY